MMSLIFICFHVVVWTTGVHANTIYLSPVNVNVVENTSVTLTCSKTNGQLQESRWTNSQIRDQEANLFYFNGQCKTTRFLQNNNLYVGVCNGNGTYSVILKRIDRLQHGAKWQCKESNNAASNTVTVNVAVPLANVDVYQPNDFYLKENHQYIIKCSTSACRPQPTINWYLYNANSLLKYNVTEHSTQTTIENKDGLVAAESLLNLLLNRSVNGWMLHCEAWTDNRNSERASRQIALNISYPPDSPPIIHGNENGSIYRVIESDQGEFSCSVTGGNPLANLSWNCFDSESTNMIIVNITVILNVTWTAKRNTNICSCEAYHIFHGKQATNVTIDVLYAMPYTVTLTKSESQVLEHDDLLLKCGSNGTFKYPFSYWDSSRFDNTITGLPIVGFYFGVCTTTYPFNNTNLYQANCYENETFTLKLKSVRRIQHGQKWQCFRRYDNGSAAASNTISVYVKVPVDNAAITSHQQDVLSVCEFSTVRMECTTSEARPAPTITWLLKNTASTEAFSINGNNSISNETGLYVTTSTLVLSPNKSLNNWNIVCSSNPPDNIPVVTEPTLGNADTYSIIEHEEGKLTCLITGGNPTATLKWQCINNGNTAVVSSNKVKKDVVWNASRDDVKTCRCTAGHSCHNWTRFVMVNIQVMYPPVAEAIDDISVIEGSMLNIPCNATRGVPEHMIFKWTRDTDEFAMRSQVLFIANVTRNDTSQYKCTVRNIMTTTGGTPKKGYHSAVFSLDVLYPAQVGEMFNMTIVEGDDIDITCPVVPGNPTNAKVTCTPYGDLGDSNNGKLRISPISRADKGVYVCSVNTTMKPTHSKHIWKVKKGTFQLSVVYNASVLKFYVGNQTGRDIVTANEKENMTFRCYFDSNPPPRAALIYNSHEVYMSYNNILEYEKQNLQCNDFGEYMCSGMNDYNNGIPSTRNLTLYVNCSPRPSPDVMLQERVVTARNNSATLSFTALAYPKPGPSGFTWWFLTGSDSNKLTNNTNVKVFNSNIQSILTIKNVSESNFGQYLLHIKNPIDVFEQKFLLAPYEEPDPPVILNWTVGVTNITLLIEAGFNEGYPQWFNLRYVEETEEKWRTVTIADKIVDVFSYAIVGLLSGRTYRVILYAENILGNSSEVMIIATTIGSFNQQPATDDSTNTVAFVGVGIGTFAATLAIVAFALLGYRLLRLKRNREHHDRQTTRSVLTYEDLDAKKREGDMYSQLPATYEQLNNDR